MATGEGPKLELRCMVYSAECDNRPGYFAICIDLNLISWRPTLRGAKQSLDQAIRGYLETVFETATKEELQTKGIRKLVLRPAAFWPYQFQYYLAKAIGKGKRPTPRRSVFSEFYPLTA